MTYLLTFISGILFISFLAPILDAFGTYLQNWWGAKSVKLQVQAEKDKMEADANPVHAVGFRYDAPEEDWEDDEE